MRTSEHSTRCSRCPSAIVVRLTFPTWVQKAAEYVDKIGAAEKWDLEKKLCPVCKGPTAEVQP